MGRAVRRVLEKMFSDGILRLSIVALALVCISAVDIPGHKTTYTVESPGSGASVKKGSTVSVHATGIVKQIGKKFWSTKDPGQSPFEYEAGVGSVIVGWDQGCLGMKLGEVRKLDIPAHEGYGENGFPAWGIPPG